MNSTLGNTYEGERPGILFVFLANLNEARLKNFRNQNKGEGQKKKKRVEGGCGTNTASASEIKIE